MTYILKVGDFVDCHGTWREVLALRPVSYCLRVAVPSPNSANPVVLRTTAKEYESTECIKTPIQLEYELRLGMIKEDTVVRGADVASKAHKMSYGDLNAFAEGVLDCENDGCSNGVVSWLCESDIVNRILPDISVRRHVSAVYRPFKSEIREGNIALTRNAVDAKRDRQTSMKPGRAFRHMFPWLDDIAISALAEAWIEDSSPRELFLHTGKTSNDFRRAYDHTRASYRNPATTHNRKSLASSCMQGVTSGWDSDKGREYSVGEAYASGDFSVAWLETKEGDIAGRVVYLDVAEMSHFSGPIYGCCEQSLNMLQQHLDSIDAVFDVEAWDGARLAVVGSVSEPVVPYIDGDLHGHIRGEGKYIHLSNYDGDFTFDNTDGTHSGGEHCCGCGDSVSEEDVFYTDDGPMCDCCFNENYVHLESGEITSIEYASFVYTKNRWGVDQVWVYEDDAVWCEVLQEMWHTDDVVFTEDGDNAVPTHLTCDFPELFPVEEDDEDLEEAA
jgi:hypothetical protein